MFKIKTNTKKEAVFLFAIMFYVTCKITTDPLFFRTHMFHFFDYSMLISFSAFIFPLVYVLSDLIVFLKGRLIAIYVVLIGTFCDGFFSYSVYASSFFSQPTFPAEQVQQASRSYAVDTLSSGFPPLWYHGLIASIITAIVEVIIFSFFLKKLKRFSSATIISISITLISHNLFLDYPMVKAGYMTWSRVINNLIFEISIIIVYAIIIDIFILFTTRTSKKETVLKPEPKGVPI
ncbi:MAG: hypothetical protein EP298_12160 [Gammaproteobacteria bacterium]|nr:MAG: hypothetical protein EP298_12160 [Gammaproteobacteria bacterium]UTW43048.1 hypothetical protein KFE69_02585 [bacterium SCSIO 12844]